MDKIEKVTSNRIVTVWFPRIEGLDICIYTSEKPVIDLIWKMPHFIPCWRQWLKLIRVIPPNTKKYAVERPKNVLLVKLYPNLRSLYRGEGVCVFYLEDVKTESDNTKVLWALQMDYWMILNIMYYELVSCFVFLKEVFSPLKWFKTLCCCYFFHDVKVTIHRCFTDLFTSVSEKRLTKYNYNLLNNVLSLNAFF